MSILLFPLVPTTASGDTDQRSYGGPFTLVDHTGNTVTDADFRGEYMLVYFGYINCPDICPMGLSHMTSAIRQMGETGASVRPVFITVDPQRDTVEKLGGYVSAFHPRLVALTGSRGQVAKAATAYKVDFIISEINGDISSITPLTCIRCVRAASSSRGSNTVSTARSWPRRSSAR